MKKFLKRWLGIDALREEFTEFIDSDAVRSLVATQNTMILKAKQATMSILADPKTKITRDWDLRLEHTTFVAKRGKDSVMVSHWWTFATQGYACITQIENETVSFEDKSAEEAYKYAEKTFTARGK